MPCHAVLCPLACVFPAVITVDHRRLVSLMCMSASHSRVEPAAILYTAMGPGVFAVAERILRAAVDNCGIVQV